MPSSGRSGFTLVELLIVVVIIGVLAAIAVPKFSSTKEKAFVAALKSDLHNLAAAQETYAAGVTPPVYAASLADLTNYTPSAGVNVSLLAATGSGWSASATHDNASGTNCAIFYGTAAPVAPATVSGAVACN